MDRYEYLAPTMGTMLKMVVYAGSPESARMGIEACLDEIERLIPILNNYDPESEISRLPQNPNQRQALSPDLAAVFREALRWYRQSQGYFDITLGPLTQLWSQARRNRNLPSPEALDEAKAKCGWDKLRLEWASESAEAPSTIELLTEGMRIDLSGIATGYIIDRAIEAMQRRSTIESFLIDIGGDIAVGVSPPDTQGWRIDLGGIGKSSPPMRRVHRHLCAVTSSGDLNQFVEIDGRRYSHLMDPHHFRPIERRQSASVIAETTLDADVGATTLCVLGMDRASQWFETLPLQEAYLLEVDAGSNPSTDGTVRYRHLS